MILKDGQKWACRSCITGHRSSKCVHEERELFPIAKKGRPSTASKCKTCRDQQANQSEPVICKCETPQRVKAKVSPSLTTQDPGSSVAASPNGAVRSDSNGSSTSGHATVARPTGLHLKDTKSRKRNNESEASSDHQGPTRRLSLKPERSGSGETSKSPPRLPSLHHQSSSSSADSTPAVPSFPDSQLQPQLPLPALHHYNSMPQLSSMLMKSAALGNFDGGRGTSTNGVSDAYLWQNQVPPPSPLPPSMLHHDQNHQQPAYHRQESSYSQPSYPSYSTYEHHRPTSTAPPELAYTSYNSWSDNGQPRQPYAPHYQSSAASSYQTYSEPETMQQGAFPGYDACRGGPPSKPSLNQHFSQDRAVDVGSSQDVYANEPGYSNQWPMSEQEQAWKNYRDSRYMPTSADDGRESYPYYDSRLDEGRARPADTGLDSGSHQVHSHTGQTQQYGLSGVSYHHHYSGESNHDHEATVSLPQSNYSSLSHAPSVIPPSNIQLKLPESRRKNR